MRLMHALIMVVSLTATAVFAGGNHKGIIVTGQGEVSMVPDMATISLGVTNRADDAKQAATRTANAVAGILAGLEERGIKPQDLQTSRFFLQPVWSDPGPSESGPSVIEGYIAGNSVSVKVRDLRFLGDVIDAAVDLGGNNFNGLQFGLRDDGPALAAARKAAVADAVTKARQLAEAAGLKLGGILQMTENSHGGGPVMAEMSRSRAMGDAIVPGELNVTANVTIVFGIRPDI